MTEPAPPRATIVLLVGPKGAGKSTLGAALAASAGIAFLRVEPIDLAVMRANPGLEPARLEPIGFGAILDAVDALARNAAAICLESTGTAGFFQEFLRRLRAAHRVVIVRVSAPLDLCAQRVRERDRVDHIPVSDERVRAINRIAQAVALDWDLELDTAAPVRIEANVEAIARRLHAIAADPRSGTAGPASGC
jgi:chloramphenicol 3-O-phosphotransferase